MPPKIPGLEKRWDTQRVLQTETFLTPIAVPDFARGKPRGFGTCAAILAALVSRPQNLWQVTQLFGETLTIKYPRPFNRGEESPERP